MKVRFLLSIAALGVAAAVPAAAQTTLNVVSAGDQNMVDYVNNYLGPKFEAMNPGVKVRAVIADRGDDRAAHGDRRPPRALGQHRPPGPYDQVIPHLDPCPLARNAAEGPAGARSPCCGWRPGPPRRTPAR